MPSNTVRDALHDSKGCLFRGYNRHLNNSWKASPTPLGGILTTIVTGLHKKNDAATLASRGI